jgi:hypothetical protein
MIIQEQLVSKEWIMIGTIGQPNEKPKIPWEYQLVDASELYQEARAKSWIAH